jgi:hypothetical protein
MLDGKHDFSDIRDEQSGTADGRPDMSDLLARLDTLEKALGHFVRETCRDAGPARMGSSREGSCGG